MADKKQLERLKKSVAAWNAWVALYNKPIDLKGANLKGANLDGATLYGANLYRANLKGANLYGATLDGATLDGANLYGANLYGANLKGATLKGATLDGANLNGATLYGANLYGATLDGANLYGATLDGANLDGANLKGATLYGANLKGANLDLLHIPPPVLLLADWGTVSDDLCRDLMRYDAANHPDGDAAFDGWKKTGKCPYESTHWLRSANFYERRELWIPGQAPSALELCERLIAEKCKVRR